VIWPEPSNQDEQDERDGLHWKTRALVGWALGFDLLPRIKQINKVKLYRPAAGETEGTLFDDDIRCPVHVADLAAVLLELSAMAPYDEFGGVLHAGSDALSRHELGCLFAERGGLDVGALPKASKASVGAKGTTVRLDSRRRRTACWPRSSAGAREFAANSVS
jgi:dTDP-4-dehydrorhamnose reductase